MRATLVLVCALTLAACSGMPSVKRESRSNKFEAAVKTYTKLMRWGYFDEAAKYVRSRDGAPIEVDLARISSFRVSAYRNVSQLMADSGEEGRVVAMIDYYQIDSGVIRTLRDEQLWWYDEETKRWHLGSPLPAFGAASP
ncbi:MAG: hypothetical protein ACU85V_06780 [Gammaproteobacteria bacterium]